MKKRNIKNFGITVGAVAASIISANFYFKFQNDTFTVKKHFVEVGIKNPLRVLQISDLHDKQFGNGNIHLKNKIFKISPDLILLTGDTISAGGKNLLRTCRFLSEIAKKNLVVGILGNHEQRGGKEKLITDSMKAAGVVLLKNEMITLRLKDINVNILGLCEKQAINRIDYLMGLLGLVEYEDKSDLLQQFEKTDGIKLLLSHFPENYGKIGEQSYNKFNFTLQLSGHAHGGQVRLPFIGGIYAPGQGFFPKYDKGLYKGKNNNLLVSAGLGNDSLVPRINNRATLDLITFY